MCLHYTLIIHNTDSLSIKFFADILNLMKYISIVLCGPVASGTSTAAKALAAKLNLEYHSVGEFFRDYMKKHNIPLPAKEKVPDDVEREVDGKLTQLLAAKKAVIIDGLYQAYFARHMPHVLKVLLTADENVRIKRALERTHTHKETAGDVKKRDLAHDAKFRKLYANENFLDPKFFDLIIDTTNTQQEKVSEKISEKFLSSRSTG